MHQLMHWMLTWKKVTCLLFLTVSWIVRNVLNVILSAPSYYNFAVGDANERIGSLENRTGQFEEKVMSIENTITNIQGINASGCHYDTDSQLRWRSFVLLFCFAFCCFSLTKTWNRKENKRTMDPGPEYDGVLLALSALYTW